MSLSTEAVLEALRKVEHPRTGSDVLSAGAVRNLVVSGGRVDFDVVADDPGIARAIEHLARAAIGRLDGVREVNARPVRTGGPAGLKMAGGGAVSAPRPEAPSGGVDPGLIPEVRYTVAVASGKGGVGKSTVAVNLAVALARQGRRVGLLDADIYGPSIPLMMGIQEQPELTPEKKLIPFERYGVRLMSLGFLVEPGTAVIWRGPMVMKAIDQLLRDVTWGPLDVLVVDLPPGTGDAQLTLAQKVRLAGAVIVTTPQDVALADAIKGVSMFRKLDVPILGLVENMSYFLCPHCSERSEIFGHGGGVAEAERMGVPCLGQVPLNLAICRGGDEGRPVAGDAPDSPLAQIFDTIASGVLSRLGEPGDSAAAGRGSVFERFRKIWRSEP